MSENVIQSSFASGELSPSLFARVDIAKYHSGAARMRNAFVDYRSGSSTRPGTEFIRPTKQGLGPVRIKGFQQSNAVTYVLEFGDHYLRFLTNGASVVEPAKNITTIPRGTNTVVTTSAAHGFSTGDLVFISGVGGMLQVDNRYFLVGTTTSTTFQVRNPFTNTAVDSTNWLVYTSGGIAQRVYTISTPYASDELAQLKFSQKASIMNITHPNHPPFKLQLISATNWTLTAAVFGASIAAPSITSVTASATGPAFLLYAVTAIDADGQETPHGGLGAGSAVLDLRTTAGTIQLTTGGSTGATSYSFYKTSVSYLGGLTGQEQLGFIGNQPGQLFLDSNIAPDFTSTPPIHNNPFVGVDANPQVSSYFQQRLAYANGGGDDVDKFWMSKVGSYYNFDISEPTQADDSIDGRLVSLEVNEIKSLIPMPTGLVALTTKGAWLISGGTGGVASQGGPITPSSLTATPQAYIGANDVPPILINYDILYVQAKGSIVRDLSYNIYANIYTGNDISILSNHLFYGHQILEWAYAEEPFKIVWCVREDGTMISLTILKEQDMYGWSRHDTYGNFKSVASVTEGATDATYFVVDRPNPFGEGIVKQIERLAERQFPFGAEDSWSVDAGAKTTANAPNATLSISVPDINNNVTLTTNVDVFTIDMVGWIMRFGGGKVKVAIFTNGSLISGQVIQKITDLIPDSPGGKPKDQPPGNWTIDKPFTRVFGLDHLEGQHVSVLADGGVVPNMTVHDGSITLPQPATKVVAGYGFQAQLQTMPLDLGNEQNTIQGKRKKVSALTVRVKDSRGVKAGRTFDHLVPIKELNRTTTLGLSIPLVTGDERIIMDPLWDVPGQICLQVDDPLPATVLGVIPEIVVGDTVK